jgi:transcriptional regulator with XRE-family HTH domain
MAVDDGRSDGHAGERFGDALRSVRVRLNLSQGQLAQKVGLDRSYINRLEAGERGAPSANAIVAMASALDLDELDTDRLLISAGLPVKALVDLGLDDPTLLALARRLTDPRLSPISRAALRATVDALLIHWANPFPTPGTDLHSGRLAPSSARASGGSGRSSAGRPRP